MRCFCTGLRPFLADDACDWIPSSTRVDGGGIGLFLLVVDLQGGQKRQRPQTASGCDPVSLAGTIVDHQSDYIFVHLMRDLTLDKMLLAKTSFERHAANGGITIKAYRADNSRFADNVFEDSVQESNQ